MTRMTLIGIHLFCAMLAADSTALADRNQTGRKTNQKPSEVRMNKDLPRKPKVTT